MGTTADSDPKLEWLSDSQKEHYRKLLNQMLPDVLSGSPLVDGTAATDRLPDPSDRATQESELHFSRTMQERHRGLLRKIEEALDRIENGTYGICEECEEPIAEGRLNARPVATLCIDCKIQEEEYERLRDQ